MSRLETVRVWLPGESPMSNLELHCDVRVHAGRRAILAPALRLLSRLPPPIAVN